MKLEPDLIPRSSFFRNLRAMIKPDEWDTVRRAVYSRSGHKCDICGAAGKMECHEKWEYDEKTGIQKLVGLTCLCSDCHEVKHIGLAQVRGRYREALEHLKKINRISTEEAEVIVEEAFEIWRARSERTWKLDVSALNDLVK